MLPQRKLNRMPGYDYSSAGAYHVVLCTKKQQKYFGEIIEGKMILNEYGNIANHYWKEIPQYYKNIRLDEFIIMPDHIHGIIILDNAELFDPGDRIEYYDPGVRTEYYSVRTAHILSYGKLSKIIMSFKSIVTKIIRNQYKDSNFAWQRSFWDSIIRSKEQLNFTREYIKNNPAN